MCYHYNNHLLLFQIHISWIVLVISDFTNVSKLDVASSKINSEGLRSNALAIANLCLCPPDNFNHHSPIFVSNHSALSNINCLIWAESNTANISLSVASGFTNNKLSLIVPANSCDSCDTYQTDCLRASGL